MIFIFYIAGVKDARGSGYQFSPVLESGIFDNCAEKGKKERGNTRNNGMMGIDAFLGE